MQNMTESPKFSSLCQSSYKKEFSLRYSYIISVMWLWMWRLGDKNPENYHLPCHILTWDPKFLAKNTQKGSFILQFSFKINMYNKMFQLCGFYLPETENFGKRKTFL